MLFKGFYKSNQNCVCFYSSLISGYQGTMGLDELIYGSTGSWNCSEWDVDKIFPHCFKLFFFSVPFDCSPCTRNLILSSEIAGITQFPIKTTFSFFFFSPPAKNTRCTSYSSQKERVLDNPVGNKLVQNLKPFYNALTPDCLIPFFCVNQQ